MKKWFVGILVLALLFSCCGAAYADNLGSNSSKNKDSEGEEPVQFVEVMGKDGAAAYIDIVGLSNRVCLVAGKAYYAAQDENYLYIITLDAEQAEEMEEQQEYWLMDEVDDPSEYHVVGEMGTVDETVREQFIKYFELTDEEFDTYFGDYFLDAATAAIVDYGPIDVTLQAVVKLVQQGLNDNGYNCGTPDGVAGKNTANAILSFQTDHEMEVTGAIDETLIVALGIADEAAALTEKEANKINYRTDITFENLARTPDNFIGEQIKLRGEVIQVLEGSGETQILLNVNGSYDQTILAVYESSIVSSRILEDDWITIYGTSYGLYSYESIFGQIITVPLLLVDIIDQ